MAATQELLLGEGAGGPVTYIEEVFSTYLWTGTDATQTITNNIDLSTKGGLVWMKRRDSIGDNGLFDTVRGSYRLISNSTAAQVANSQISSFNTTGFTLSAGGDYNSLFGGIGETVVGWTFRKQPKFFDVVTYTGTGVARTVAHSLGSVPGCIIVKRTDVGGQDWTVYHRSTGNTKRMNLNLADTGNVSSGYWNNTTPTSTDFTVGTINDVNASGSTYVAYLFAHDAGGFGLTGTDNVISCGSIALDGTNYSTVNLGWEPQWVLIKNSTSISSGAWEICDSMRGMPATSGENYLLANTSAAEGTGGYNLVRPTSTGFSANSSAGTYIYIAIRRGPMKVPTDATKVFKSVLWTGNDVASRNISGIGFVPDVANLVRRNSTGPYFTSAFYDRLRGIPALATNSTQTEAFWAGTAVNMGAFGQADLTLPSNTVEWNDSPTTFVGQFFQRAPSFCDEVCYTGTGTTTTVTHNLGVAPELMIIKNRGGTQNWTVYSAPTGNTQWLYVNTTNAVQSGTSLWNNTSPTSTNFTVINSSFVNGAGSNYVAWLFASCPGVSKVGSYTGTGTLTTINCGFSGGARFVMIKRTDLDSDWFIWDTARGMVAGTDPAYTWDVATTEFNANSVYTISTGFQLLAAPSRDVNTSGGSYIYLAIA